jgi:uncharacterized iron-regulated membrane protein
MKEAGVSGETKRMKRSQRLMQAYRQAPWRTQLQWVGLFSAAVIFVALVAGVYLNVTARAATLGREIQDMQNEKLLMEQRIEDMETQLAVLTSAKVMEERASDLGFEPIDKNQVTYVIVPGYGGRETAALAPMPGAERGEFTFLPPEFTLSLIDWIFGVIDGFAGSSAGGGQP